VRLAAASLLLLAACASSSKEEGPPVSLELALTTPSNVLYFPGPVNLQFAVTLTNPTDQPVTLRRLDLRTVGNYSVFLRANGAPMHVEVKPHASATIAIAAWGASRGGMLAQDEPMQMQATAYFDGPKGPFVKLLTTVLSPQ